MYPLDIECTCPDECGEVVCEIFKNVLGLRVNEFNETYEVFII